MTPPNQAVAVDPMLLDDPSALYPTLTQAGAVQRQSARPSGQDPWVGHQLRDYLIEGFIGAGGMGRVYLARHQWLDMPVAIKILNESLGEDEGSLARFRREALAVARLNHPNIIRATDGGSQEGFFFLVTEFINGQNLSALLRQQGKLSVSDACAIICQTAEALQHAHEHGMVHRDVKPSNVMVTRTGEVKLLDLGLARFANCGATLTNSGQVMGTLDFMAPEQAGDTRHVDIRADIYSLGCTLYCLLTGTPPFAGPEYETAVSKMLAHADVDPPPVEQFNRSVPPAVLRCLTRMMAKDRNQRFATPGEVAQVLRPFAAGARLDLLCNGLGSGTNTPALPATESTLDLSQIMPVVGHASWVTTRTMLCLSGILEKKTTPSLRPGAPPKVSYAVSPGGVMNCLIILGVLFLIFGVMGLRFEAAPVILE